MKTNKYLMNTLFFIIDYFFVKSVTKIHGV